MKLEELRHHEDEVRALLADVREQLAVAVATIERAERAREQAAQGERRKSEGAYRDVAAERAAELLAHINAAQGAEAQRERLRREETRLLDQLERTRVGMELLGVRKSVLPILDGIPNAAPCDVRWHEMNGNGDARTCGHCKLPVVSVAMSDAARAEELIAACGRDVRLHRRSDGTIVARDCPAGVARRRFFARAPVVIVALMAVIAVAALYFANEREHEQSTDHAPPRRGPLPNVPAPNLEPGQFGSPPPTPDPPPRLDPPKTLAVHGALSLTISDGFSTLGGRTQTNVDLERSGNVFSVKLSCSFFRSSVTQTKTLPAATVDAFLDAVQSHTPRPVAKGRCGHTDDYPHIDVTVGVTPPVDLTVDNCSYQWHADGVTLDDAPDASPSEGKHEDINAAYRALLVAIGERACLDEARNKPQPSSRDEPIAGCNPPYTIHDGNKIWKRECLR